jgi:hypothetical protein
VKPLTKTRAVVGISVVTWLLLTLTTVLLSNLVRLHGESIHAAIDPAFVSAARTAGL